MLDQKFFGLSDALIADIMEVKKTSMKKKTVAKANPEIIISPEVDDGQGKPVNKSAEMSEGAILNKLAYGTAYTAGAGVRGAAKLVGKGIKAYVGAAKEGLIGKPARKPRKLKEATFQTSLVKQGAKQEDNLVKKKPKISPNKPIKTTPDTVKEGFFGFGKKKPETTFSKGSESEYNRPQRTKLVKNDPERTKPDFHFKAAQRYESAAKKHSLAGNHEDAKLHRKFRDNSLHRYVMLGGDAKKIHFKEETFTEMMLSPIERESNNAHIALHRTHGQAGPDPKVQRELKNQGVLHRVAKKKAAIESKKKLGFSISFKKKS